MNLLLKTYKTPLSWIFLYSFILNLLVLALPLYMLQIYQTILPSRHLETLLLLTLIVLFTLGIHSVLMSARMNILIGITAHSEMELSSKVASKVVDSAIEGDEYAYAAASDVLLVHQLMSSQVSLALLDLPWTIIFFIGIFVIHPILGFFSLASAVLIFAITYWNEVEVRPALSAATQEKRNTDTLWYGILRNGEVLQGMGIADKLQAIWLGMKQQGQESQVEMVLRGDVVLSIIKWIRLASQVIILGLGAWLVIRGDIVPGAIIAASIMMSKGLSPIEQIVGSWRQLLQGVDAAGRLTKYLATPSPRKHHLLLVPPKGDLLLENVHYAFPGTNRAVLQQISMSIPEGSHIAFVGPSGSGKTTLCRLILGILKPNLGKVTLDGTELFYINREEVGPYIGYLPQDVELFPGTIQDNICRYQKADREQVVRAAKLAGAHEMIANLPAGYDTVINRSGGGLSRGQLQRLGIARAVYGDPKIVCLDEPDSHLDEDGIAALSRAIAEMKSRGITLFIISHRGEVAHLMERVIFILNGKLRDMSVKEILSTQSKTEKGPS